MPKPQKEDEPCADGRSADEKILDVMIGHLRWGTAEVPVEQLAQEAGYGSIKTKSFAVSIH